MVVNEVNTLSHASQWVDENGNNTPAYNHKYWEEHKEEIKAKRKKLRAKYSQYDKFKISGKGTTLKYNKIGKVSSPSKNSKDKASGEKEKKEKAAKESSGKSKSEKSSSSKSDKDTTKNTTTTEVENTTVENQESDVNKLLKLFGDLNTNGFSDVYDSPIHDLSEFKKQIKQRTDQDLDDEKLMELWKMYRKSVGVTTSEEEEREKKSVRHGATSFDEYVSMCENLDDELSHHGVKGQHWGVKNGPPYPLSKDQLPKGRTVSESATMLYGKDGKITNFKGKKANSKTGAADLSNKEKKTPGKSANSVSTKKKTIKAPSVPSKASVGSRFKADIKKTAKNAANALSKSAKSIKSDLAKRHEEKEKKRDEKFEDKKKALMEQEAKRDAKDKVKEEAREAKEQVVRERENEINRILDERGLSEAQKASFRKSVDANLPERANDPNYYKEYFERKDAQDKANSDRREAEKQRAIVTGDVQYAKEHFTELTDNELQSILNRNTKMNNIDSALASINRTSSKSFKDMSPAEKFDAAASTIKNATNRIQTGISVYNNVAKIYNSFSSGAHLPEVGPEAMAKLKEKREKEKFSAYTKGFAKGQVVFDDFIKVIPVDKMEAANKYVNAYNNVLTKYNGLAEKPTKSVPYYDDSSKKKRLFS